eukprot:GEMP01087583.1.p1 GENE.GEMP01087583.1~~GEMP01087583.1.p1  ORF type:complete len:142 (+),score=36.92 GEMP01087583.1:18-443(+)
MGRSRSRSRSRRRGVAGSDGKNQHEAIAERIMTRVNEIVERKVQIGEVDKVIDERLQNYITNQVSHLHLEFEGKKQQALENFRNQKRQEAEESSELDDILRQNNEKVSEETERITKQIEEDKKALAEERRRKAEELKRLLL